MLRTGLMKSRYFWIVLFISSLAGGVPSTACAQFFDIDYILQIERESAEAKRVRLEFIKKEQARLREQEQQFQQELKELRDTLPDRPRPAATSAAARAQQRTLQQNFGTWMTLNDPKLRVGVTRGQIFNTMIRVLGPIASIRKARATNDSEAYFPSLAKGEHLTAADTQSLLVHSTFLSGPKTTERLNSSPLVFEWPYFVLDEWKDDCEAADKLRDEYVLKLSQAAQARSSAHIKAYEDLERCLELLEAKILKAKHAVLKDPGLPQEKKYETWEELKNAQEFIKRTRATARRYKLAPRDLKSREFAGGSIEDFLDYCYTEGLEIAPATAEDEQQYFNVFRKMQAYARDVVLIDNRKDDVKLRIADLQIQDRALLWEGANDDLDESMPAQILVEP